METLELREILEKVKSSGDFYNFDGSVESWKDLISAKLQDPQVPGLIRAIQENGFNVPILLERDYKGEWMLGNGHHRLSIAIYLGLDKIPVTNSWGESGRTYEGDITDITDKDKEGARIISNSVETAIDWQNWPTCKKERTMSNQVKTTIVDESDNYDESDPWVDDDAMDNSNKSDKTVPWGDWDTDR